MLRALMVAFVLVSGTLALGSLVPLVTSLFAAPSDQSEQAPPAVTTSVNVPVPSTPVPCGVAFPCPRGHDAPAWTDQVVDLSRGTPAGQRWGALVMPKHVRSPEDTILTLSSDHAIAKADAMAYRDAYYPGATLMMLPNESMAPSHENLSGHGPPAK